MARQRRDDTQRVLNEHGYAVLRFWNTEVLQNLDGVLAKIEAVLSEA